MFRTWLTSLLSRPRVPEDAAGPSVVTTEQETAQRLTSGRAFQPIRSQEDIQKEEAEERANSRRNRVISRFFDDVASDRVRSRR